MPRGRRLQFPQARDLGAVGGEVALDHGARGFGFGGRFAAATGGGSPPLNDRVVIKRMEEEGLSAGGIVIPDSATEKPIKGEVVAVGEGKPLDNGETRALKVKVGDKVLFGKYSGTEVKVDGTEYLVVREDDIFAIIN